MATLALGAAFAGAGYLAGGTAAASAVGLTAVSGAAIGFSVGSALGDYLFAPVTKAQGPRSGELSVTGSAYGSAIPQAWGAVRIGGQVVWAPAIDEHANRSSSGGGKGFGGGGASVTTYSYTANFAVLLCEGPISGIRRIWADANIIFDRTSAPGATDAERIAAAFSTGSAAERISIYLGGETQLPDPLIAADPQYATTGAPAYRGRAYIVFEAMALEDFGNRRPNITAELYSSGSSGVVLATADIVSPWTDGVANHVAEDTVYTVTTSGSSVNRYTHKYGQSNRLRERVTIAAPVGAPHLGDSDDENVFVASASAGSQVVVVDLKFGATAMPFELTVDGVRVRWAYRSGYLVVRSEDAGATTQTIRTFKSVSYHDNPLTDSWTALRAVTVPGPPIVGAVGLSPDGRTVYYSLAETPDIAMASFSVDGADAPVEVFRNTDGYSFTARVTDLTLLYVGAGSIWIGFDDRTYQVNAAGEVLSTYDSKRRNTRDVESMHVLNGVVINRSHALSDEWWTIPDDVGITPVSIEAVINDVASQAGATVDASALAAQSVAGYVRTKTMPARAVIEPLQQVHQFDMLESGALVRAVPRGGPSVFTVEGDYLVSEREYNVVRAQDVELPRRVVTQYISADADYQPGTQQAKRIRTHSSVELHVDLPIVLTDDEGASVAEVLLYSAWQSRESLQSLGFAPRYSRLEPCDVITFRDRGIEQRLRLTSVGFAAPGTLDCRATVEDAAVYDSSAPGGLVNVDSALVRFQGTTELALLDAHLLRASNHGAGVYAVASGSPGWRGALLYASANQQDWAQVATLTEIATRGEVGAAFGAGPVEVVDAVTKFSVKLYDGTLSSTDEMGFLAAVNVALVGDEVITFRDAVLTAPGTYEISHLARGRRGTEQHMVHAAGDSFVLLNGAVADVLLDRDLRGRNIYFRAVSAGQRIDQARSETLVYTHHRAKPYAPAQLQAAKTGVGNQYAATWLYRARASGEWTDSTGVPAAGATDQYRVEVWRAGTRVSSELVSTLSAIFDAQSGDELRVAQVTDDYGAGYESTVQLT